MEALVDDAKKRPPSKASPKVGIFDMCSHSDLMHFVA